MGAGDAFHQLRGLAAIGRLGVKCLELGPGVNQAEQADCPHLIAIQGLRHQFDAAALRIQIQAVEPFLLKTVAYALVGDPCAGKGEHGEGETGQQDVTGDQSAQPVKAALGARMRHIRPRIRVQDRSSMASDCP